MAKWKLRIYRKRNKIKNTKDTFPKILKKNSILPMRCSFNYCTYLRMVLMVQCVFREKFHLTHKAALNVKVAMISDRYINVTLLPILVQLRTYKE
jgi:hypothetical protein